LILSLTACVMKFSSFFAVDDPEERKRSLDSRSTSIDPIGLFKEQYIEPAVRSGGEFDVKELLLQAQKQLESGMLNNEEYIAVVKQITHVSSNLKWILDNPVLMGNVMQKF